MLRTLAGAHDASGVCTDGVFVRKAKKQRQHRHEKRSGPVFERKHAPTALHVASHALPTPAVHVRLAVVVGVHDLPVSVALFEKVNCPALVAHVLFVVHRISGRFGVRRNRVLGLWMGAGFR